MTDSRLPYATGTAGALLIAFSAVLVRLADVAPATAAVFRCFYALPVLALLTAREARRYGPRSRRDRGVAFAAGVFFAADLTFWHYAIDYVGAGLATVLANSQVVLVGLIAWLVLGERPRPRVLVAVPVVLVGVTLISGVIGEGAYGQDPLLGVVFGLVTALAYAGFILTLRAGNTHPRRPAGPLFDATLSAAACAALAGLLLGDIQFAPSWPAHGWLALLALSSQVLAWLLISISLPRLPAVVTSMLLMLQPVGAVALGAVLLAEAPSPVQLAGVGAVLAGIIVAASGRRPAQPPAAPVDAPPPGHSPG
ncbi:MAG: DMT family transporter [Egibacteraceae bacterium]